MAIPLKYMPLRLTLLCAALLTSACVPGPQVSAPPAQPPTQSPTQPNTPVIASQPEPVAAPVALSWRDAPITPGAWTWQGDDKTSAARFGTVAELFCDRQSKGVTLSLLGSASASGGIATVQTSTLSRVLTGEVLPEGAGGMAFKIAARDPLLDAMAFSRGRFAVEATGIAPLYLPSWPELSRVIEDCRT